jgi:hypothetical protein
MAKVKTTHVNICCVTSIGGRSSPAASAGLTDSSFSDSTVIERSHDVLLPRAGGQHNEVIYWCERALPAQEVEAEHLSPIKSRTRRFDRLHGRGRSACIADREQPFSTGSRPTRVDPADICSLFHGFAWTSRTARPFLRNARTPTLPPVLNTC